MIKIENLDKTYNAGKPTEVHALRGLSCTLPDSGLIFVVGKSGCGKSTLLNTLGLLDGFDSGDIILQGESLKELDEPSRAAYRNKHIGFVFQDYNLLEQYTVEKNIALALEMQGKTDTGEVDEMLELVELTGMRKKKVRELSGGQKQRVAIARAIVKNPQLLLCDEPTGALDYETGKTIFSLLKKISERSLVVVVSHDKEASEEYADRILELRDGQIIGDRTLADVAEEKTAEEKPKAVAKEQGKNAEQSKILFKTKLQFALSCFTKRPVRFAISLLLCVVSFVLFCFSSSVAMIKKADVVTRTMLDEDMPYLSYKKHAYDDDGDDMDALNFLEEDIRYVKQRLNVERLDKVYDVYEVDLSRYIKDSSKPNQLYYLSKRVDGFAEISNAFLQAYGFTLCGGRLPQADDELVIPKYLFNYFDAYGYKNAQGVLSTIDKYEDILGQTMELDANSGELVRKDHRSVTMKIVGILDTKFDEKRFEPLLSATDSEGDAERLITDMWGILSNGMHNILFLNEGYYDRHFAPYALDYTEGRFTYRDKNWTDRTYSALRKANSLADYKVYYNTTLTEEEREQLFQNGKGILLPISEPTESSTKLKAFIAKSIEANWTEDLSAQFDDAYSEAVKQERYVSYILTTGNGENIYESGKNFEYFRTAYVESTYFSDFDLESEITFSTMGLSGKQLSGRIVGFYAQTGMDNDILVSNRYGNELLKGRETYASDCSYVLTPMTGKYKTDRAHVAFGGKKTDVTALIYNGKEDVVGNVRYVLDNEVFSAVEDMEYVLSALSVGGKWIALGLLCVAVLFLFYYASGMVQDKQKEVGVLYAMGASKKDVTGTFLLSGGSLAVFSAAVGCIVASVVTQIVNAVFNHKYLRAISLLDFSFAQIGMTLAVALVAVVLGICLPVSRLLKKEPVQLINQSK